MEYSFEQFVAPIREINELTLKNLEKVSAIQVKALQDGTDASLNALKSAAEVRDLDSFNDYLQDQIATAQSAADNAVKDAQKIVKVAEAYANKVKEAIEKSAVAA